MRIKQLLFKTALLVAVSMLVGTSSYALTATQAKAVRKAVLSVPVPEMGSKAVELILQSEKQDREVTAVTAVRAIVFRYKASAPAVVATVSKAVPEVAAAVAAAAAQLSRSEASNIAQAAIGAAPAQANSISTAVNKSVLVASAIPTLSESSTSITPAVRGSADAGGPSSGIVVSSTQPINTTSGGRGDGRFSSNLAPTPVPTPHPKDYTKPR